MHLYGFDYVPSNGSMTLAFQGQGHSIPDHRHLICRTITANKLLSHLVPAGVLTFHETPFVDVVDGI